MKLPASLTLVNSNYWLDGGSTTLHGITETGDSIQIHLSQRMMKGMSEPGRLSVNQELIAVRSDEESEIIRLLKTATIEASDEQPGPPQGLILGDDIRRAMSSSPADNLEHFRQEFIRYLESDEYVEIAKNGIPQPPKK